MIDIDAIERMIHKGGLDCAYDDDVVQAREQLAALVESIAKLEQQIQQWKGRVANDRPDIALEIQQAEKRGYELCTKCSRQIHLGVGKNVEELYEKIYIPAYIKLHGKRPERSVSI